MNSRSFLTPFLALVLSVAACQPGGVELETRTFRLQSLPDYQAAEILEPYVYRDRGDNPGTLAVTQGAVTVRETPDNLDRIARVLEEYDRPVRTVRLRFQVVEADGSGVSAPEIAAVEEELRKLFRFEGYRVVGEGVVTAADGARFHQQLTGRAEGWTVAGSVYRTGEGSVRLDEVRLLAPDPIFETSVNVRIGQTLVIGSARAPAGEGAVILIVEAVQE